MYLEHAKKPLPLLLQAMEDEMSALGDNELAPLTEGRKSVGGRWVFTIKLGKNGEEQYKACFVAKGYSQLPDIDYHETFSPTARITSIRMLMQLAVQYNLLVHQMDVEYFITFLLDWSRCLSITY